MYPLGSVVSGYIPPQGPAEITSLSLGDTVIAGTKVVDDGKIRKVPLIYHPEYLFDKINDMKFADFLDSLISGTVKTPIARITSGAITREGNAQGFNGPGVLAVQENKLTVNPPPTFVYGYKVPYTYGVKTSNGLEIKQGKNTVKTVPYDQITNDTVPHEYSSVNSIKKWYNGAATGQRITLDYAVSSFNDGRNLVTPDKIQSLFGDKVVNYMENYPSGDPVMVYMGNAAGNVVGSGADSLGSYPEYGDVLRESNAREFVQAWNGTIIPPHSSSSGKETVGFDTAADPHAPGGSAAHGVCPSARTLRSAAYAAGFGLPVGLSNEDTAVMFGFNPAVDVKVTNSHNYPVQIIMWTEGSGTGMAIYSKIIEYRPQ
ncbi:MAG: hypothetical protein ACXVHS_01680 [Methanobacterium sp.]